MLTCLSFDSICSSKLTVFLELCSWKSVCFSEQIMSTDKYPSIFSPQMVAIVYISSHRPDNGNYIMLTWPKLGIVNIPNVTLLVYFSIVPGLFGLTEGILHLPVSTTHQNKNHGSMDLSWYAIEAWQKNQYWNSEIVWLYWIKAIRSRVLSDTHSQHLDRYSIDVLINTWLTVVQHLINSWSGRLHRKWFLRMLLIKQKIVVVMKV